MAQNLHPHQHSSQPCHCPAIAELLLRWHGYIGVLMTLSNRGKVGERQKRSGCLTVEWEQQQNPMRGVTHACATLKFVCATAITPFSHPPERLLKMTLEDLREFLQEKIAASLQYEDDAVIEQLQVSMTELRKMKFDLPPPGG